jgi:hypothetical protein
MTADALNQLFFRPSASAAAAVSFAFSLCAGEPPHICDNLPSFLFRQRLPRRHAVVQIAFGDVPEELAAPERGTVSENGMAPKD